MPPQTRSQRRLMKDSQKEENPVNNSATSSSASKPTSETPPGKRNRNNTLYPEEEAEKAPILHFANLPLELLFEIAKHLYPLDLIYLSRSNKLLRFMLMRRSAVDMWHAALTNAGLPPCPDESMSEPKYAALVYLEQCSECGKPAMRHMDPILLVHLCSACRKYMALNAEAVGTLENVLTHSQYLVPARLGARGRYRPNWYLLREYQEIKETVHELKRGDPEVWEDWLEGRLEFIHTRHERSKPLIQWIKNRDKEERRVINQLKSARVAEVEARLLKLGWELADVREAGNYSHEWTSLVYKTEPLIDADWKDTLPCLLGGLEKAKEQRLGREFRKRRSSRERIIEDWLPLLSVQLGPTIITLCWRNPGERSSPAPIEKPYETLYPQGIEKEDISISIPSIPPSSDLMKHCPHLIHLLDLDVPTEELQLKFQETQNYLIEQYSGWRTNLEAALAKELPNDLKPIETRTTDFDLLSADHLSAGNSTNSGDHLSTDLKLLLRADVRFKYPDGTYYYPYYSSGFESLTKARGGSTYDMAFSTAAKAILHTLRRPDASYMEMRALGQSFLCVRCIDDPKYYTWDGIVTHYVREGEVWGGVQSLNQVHIEEGDGITILPTHNLDEINGKPLVHLVATEDQVSPSSEYRLGCRVCLRIGHRHRTGASYIARHVREVHLIEEPVSGRHYGFIL